MSRHRIVDFVLLLSLACMAPLAHSTPTPMNDFIDVRIEKPRIVKHVKRAIVQAALSMKWDIVDDADGSLLASKPNRHAVKVRLTFDGAKYSLKYVSSNQLDFTNEEGLSVYKKKDLDKEEAESLEKFKDSVDTPFAVRTKFWIDDDYEDYVRDLLDAIRRHVEAPDF